jgi:hypothetical protein
MAKAALVALLQAVLPSDSGHSIMLDELGFSIVQLDSLNRFLVSHGLYLAIVSGEEGEIARVELQQIEEEGPPDEPPRD